MKSNGLLALVCGFLCVFPGCKSPTIDYSKAPDGYYAVYGHVVHPGLIRCTGTNETLSSLISKARGFSEALDDPYLKEIIVRNQNTTNSYNFHKIQNHLMDDPIIPCGSVIYVPIAVW